MVFEYDQQYNHVIELNANLNYCSPSCLAMQLNCNVVIGRKVHML